MLVVALLSQRIQAFQSLLSVGKAIGRLVVPPRQGPRPLGGYSGSVASAKIEKK